MLHQSDFGLASLVLTLEVIAKHEHCVLISGLVQDQGILVLILGGCGNLDVFRSIMSVALPNLT